MLKKILIFSITLLLLVTSTMPASAAAALPAPTSSLKPGVHYAASGLTVSLYAQSGATIIYTTNGSTPQASFNIFGRLSIQNGSQYSRSISLNRNTTVKAIAVKWRIANSPVTALTYEIYNPNALDTQIKANFAKFNYATFPNRAYFTAANNSRGYFDKTYSGIRAGTVNCTWYTLVHLQSMGRNFPFDKANGANGRDWYGKAVSSSKYPGSNSLSDLVAANKNRPVYNIVVSFEKNGTGTAGHVMLIDAIVNGKVYYSDNGKPGVLQTVASITEFKNKYYSYNGNIVGVVHMK